MKLSTLVLTCSLILPFLSQAAVKNLHCEGNLVKQSNDQYIEFAGAYIGGWIKNAVAKVSYEAYSSRFMVEVGRAAQLEKDEKYNPRKYVGYERYDLSKLTDVKDFGTFTPIDQCQIYLLLPENLATTKNFKAPVLVHCDQAGGAGEIQCSYR